MPTEELMAEIGGIQKCPNGLNYAYKPMGHKILAVAHCDSVTCDTDHFFTKNGIVWCTRLDDRLGVFAILNVLPVLGIPVDILLTDGEETCNSTAKHFHIPELEGRYNWIVQFDRRGTDVVTYQFDEMDPHIKKHICDPGYGSYSDICELDWLGCAAMNVGVGYHDEHTLGSHAKLWEFRSQMRKFKNFYENMKDTFVEHKQGYYYRKKSGKGAFGYQTTQGYQGYNYNGSTGSRNIIGSSSGTGSSRSGTNTDSTRFRHFGQNVSGTADNYNTNDSYYRHDVGASVPFGSSWAGKLTTGLRLEQKQNTEAEESAEDVEGVTLLGGYEDWPCFQITFKDGKTVSDVYAPDKETAIEWARESRRDVDDIHWRDAWNEYINRDDIRVAGSPASDPNLDIPDDSEQMEREEMERFDLIKTAQDEEGDIELEEPTILEGEVMKGAGHSPLLDEWPNRDESDERAGAHSEDGLSATPDDDLVITSLR
jgi:hypothetical protein